MMRLLYFILLAKSIYAAPASKMTAIIHELLDLTTNMTNILQVNKSFRIQTPIKMETSGCASKIFDGLRSLETQVTEEKYKVFFQNAEALKKLLPQNMETKTTCATEGMNARKFLEKVKYFLLILQMEQQS